MSMSTLRMLVTTLVALVSFSAAAADGEYYTQHNLWIFKGNSSTVNYAVDALVPVNSKVKVIKEHGDKMALQLSDGGSKFTVVLAKKFSDKTMADIKARLLGDKPVELSKFSKLAQEAIKFGEIKPGMTRAEVLVARGYPPERSTLSLDSDSWKYNQSKWNTIIVQFEGNKVSSIRD